MNDDKLNQIDKQIFVHSEKINDLEKFQDVHENEHKTLILEQNSNTLKLKFIEKLMMLVTTTVVAYLVSQVLQFVNK